VRHGLEIPSKRQDTGDTGEFGRRHPLNDEAASATTASIANLIRLEKPLRLCFR